MASIPAGMKTALLAIAVAAVMGMGAIIGLGFALWKGPASAEISTIAQEQEVYRVSCDRIRGSLRAPRTAIFSSLGQDPEASIIRHDNRVFEVSGFVDSQNGFGALIRSRWIIGAQGPGLDVFYVKLGEQEMGHYGEIALRAAGDSVRVNPPSAPPE